jgi:2-methylcitrate dehydratase PrpD
LRALTEGKVVLEHFEDFAHTDARIQALLPRTQSSRYEGPFFNDDDRFDAIVRVELKTGRVFETKVDAPLGRTAADAVPTEALDDKFRDCAGRVLSKEAADAVCRRLWEIDKAVSVREVTAMLEPPPEPNLRIRVAETSVHA